MVIKTQCICFLGLFALSTNAQAKNINTEQTADTAKITEDRCEPSVYAEIISYFDRNYRRNQMIVCQRKLEMNPQRVKADLEYFQLPEDDADYREKASVFSPQTLSNVLKKPAGENITIKSEAETKLKSELPLLPGFTNKQN